jgi:CHAD domain-containing protein
MAYRLKKQEEVGAGLKRILLEEVAEARTRLTDDLERDPTEAIHDARKRLKKCRAVLRLVRADIGKKEFGSLNRGFRDTGRLLSSTRDADVLLITLENLIDDRRRFVGIRAALRERSDELRGQISGDAGPVSEARANLDDLELSVRHLTFNSTGASLFLGGFKDCYAGGRRALSESLDAPTNENLHEWRKRSKDVWYHLRILKSVWPEAIESLIDEAHRLSDLLGDDHDLAVLADSLVANGDGFKEEQVNAIRRLISERRPQLQADAFTLGARLFAEKPGQYARRFGAYWEASEADPSTTPGTVLAGTVASTRS